MLKSLEQVELSETCEAILAEFRIREAEKIRVEAQRKLYRNQPMTTSVRLTVTATCNP